jgi:hypothetical protein
MTGINGPAGPRAEVGARQVDNYEREVLKEKMENALINPADMDNIVDKKFQGIEIKLNPEEVLTLKMLMSKRQSIEAEKRIFILRLERANAASIIVAKDEAIALAGIMRNHNLPVQYGIAKLSGNKLLIQ